MKVTAINTLVHLLENIPPESQQGFNMHYYLEDAFGETTNVAHTCGTVACLAGWTAQRLSMRGDQILTLPRTQNDIRKHAVVAYYEHGVHQLAQKILGLTAKQADQLFTPMDYFYDEEELEDVNWADIQPAQAVKVLKHLRDTGEVDWKVAF